MDYIYTDTEMAPWIIGYRCTHLKLSVCLKPLRHFKKSFTRLVRKQYKPLFRRLRYESDRFPYLKPIPRARFTQRPDDGGSKYLWNVG
jgi:hypothetical protein